MATRDSNFSYKQNKWDANNQSSNFNDQFNNLNLNQNHQGYNLPVLSSRSNFDKQQNFNDYPYGNEHNNDRQQIWNKNDNRNNFFQTSLTNYMDSKEDVKKNDNDKYSNGYSTPPWMEDDENRYDEENNNDFNDNDNFRKESIKKTQQQKQDPFSFPRQQQQENEVTDEPQVIPFKASVKLFEPNVAASCPEVSAKKAVIVPKQDNSWDKEFSDFSFKLDEKENYWIPDHIKAQLMFFPKKQQFNCMIKNPTYLSSGTFGSVSLCNVYGLKQEFVRKTLKYVKLVEIEAELKVYTNIQSPYIPRLFYAGFDKNDYYTFVTEYISGGPLNHHVGKIPLDGIKFIAYEIACGLQCLHEKNLSHGDLKPNNIALTPDGHVKLLDFGNSRDISKPSYLPGTCMAFQAPEITAMLPASAPSDWYSYGCVLMELYQKKRYIGFRQKIDDPIGNNFIGKLLIRNPDERLTNVFEHEYLQLGENPKQVYVPGVITLEKRPQPFDEINNKTKLFGLPWWVYSDVLKFELHRFPSKKILDSFERF